MENHPYHSQEKWKLASARYFNATIRLNERGIEISESRRSPWRLVDLSLRPANRHREFYHDCLGNNEEF